MFELGVVNSFFLTASGYPWDSVFSGNIGRIERWLYIPHTGADTLDKNLLYGETVVMNNITDVLIILPLSTVNLTVILVY